MLPLICAITCGLANIAVGCSMKGAQNANCRTAWFGSVATGIACLLSMALLPFFSGPCDSGGVWLIGIALGCLFCTVIVLGVLANSMGPPSLAWSMANMGLLIPIGLAFLMGESLRWTDAIMLLVFGLMLSAFHRGIAKADDAINTRPWIYGLLLLAVFLGNGLLMFCFKLNQLLFPAANKASLLVAMYGSGFILFVLFSVIWHRPWHGIGSKTFLGEVKWGVMLGAAISITQILMQSAMSLPAIIVFPLVQGLSLIGGVGLMAYVYREKLNVFKIIGIISGLIVVILSVLR